MRAILPGCLAALILLPGVAAAEPVATPGATVQTPGESTNPAAIGRPHICTVADYYTPELRRSGAVGRVWMLFDVGADGAVHDPVVQMSSGNTELDAAAIRCVLSFRYVPATRHGVAVDVNWAAGVAFALNGELGPSGTSVPPKTGPGNTCAEHRSTTGAPPPRDAVFYFTVSEDGSVKNVMLRQSSGDATYDDYAAACVSHWTFTPAQQYGAPVAAGSVARLSW
jgi:TonB family protein